MRDEQSDSYRCAVCLGEWPEPEASMSSAEIISIATGEALRGFWQPDHNVPKDIVDAAKRADIRLAAVRQCDE